MTLFFPPILKTLVYQEMFVHCSCTKANSLTGKEEEMGGWETRGHNEQ